MHERETSDAHYIPYLKRWCSGDEKKICEYSRPHNGIHEPRIYPVQTGFQDRLYEKKGVPKIIAQQVEDDFMKSVDTLASDALLLIETGDAKIDTDAGGCAWLVRFEHGDGNLSSRPVFHDGQPVHCRDAVERRDRMIERLASLAPVQGALDQIVQRFGTDLVAEVTGRSRRIVRKRGQDGADRFAVEARAGSANLAEAQAFMDDEKRILVFSDAGGTGRSYHADLTAKNQRLRVHYLLTRQVTSAERQIGLQVFQAVE